MRCAFALGLLLATNLGCGDSTPGFERTPLLAPTSLTLLDAATDPLADHRPPDDACPPAAWRPEAGGFEVQTGACRYAAFEQPLPVQPAGGDQLRVLLWHDVLNAPTPAKGHVAVLLGGRVAWEVELDIPAASASMEAVVAIPEGLPDGARLGLHLHNHGNNSWRFYAIDLLRKSH
jgi:hypothetical protein